MKMTKLKLPAWAEKDPDVAKLLRHLDFEEAQAVAAAQEQPRLFYEAARLKAECTRKRLQCKNALQVLIAELTLEIRNDLIAAGERPSGPLVKARVLTHKKFAKAQADLELAMEMEEDAKLLVNAYRHRRDAIRAVVDQNRAEFGANSRRVLEEIDRDDLRRRLRAKYPGMEA